MRYARRAGGIVGAIVLIWLLIGVLEAWQRDYFKGGNTRCASAATIALTVLIGPLNYAGVNPKVTDSNSAVTIVLKGRQPLGEDAHRYYDYLIRQLSQDPKHVQHIQDLWSDRLTAPRGSAKTAYIELNLAGQQDETLANESVEAVRHVVGVTPAPPGVKSYVVGPCHSPQPSSLKAVDIEKLTA